MIKAVFFDIDGTLVSFETHEIPDSARRALQKLRENGIRVFIATGRGKDGLSCLEGLTFDGYITLNGQYCYVDDKVIYENTVPQEDLAILLEELEKHPFPCGFTMEHNKIFNYRDERVDLIHSITKNDNHPAGDVSGVLHEKIYQCMAFISEDEEKELMKKLTRCTSARWHPSFCDISPIGGTKQNGIDQLLKYYGIDLSETMAFGDGGNDRQMLEHVSLAVAMGNAAEELKEIADYITDDVEHDGVEKALIHFGLIQ